MVSYEYYSINKMIILVILLVSFSGALCAQNITLEVDQEAPEPSKIILPFVFHTEALQTAYGVFLAGSGHFQPQASVFGAAFATTNDTVAGFIGMQDIQFPFARRLFLTLYGSKGESLDFADSNKEDLTQKAGKIFLKARKKLDDLLS